MFGLLILLFACGVVYLLAWGLAWVVGKFAAVPDWLRPALPWLLFQVYIVGGLLLTGDLPGAPRAVLMFSLLVGGVSLLFGLLSRLRRGSQQGWATLGGWMLAGLLPWAVALAAEAIA